MNALPSLRVVLCDLDNRSDLDCLFARSLAECALGLHKGRESCKINRSRQSGADPVFATSFCQAAISDQAKITIIVL